MKFNLTKIAKSIAFTVFFMAMFLNVKVSLEDPFIKITSDVIAQMTSSSHGNPPTCLSECSYDPGFLCSFTTVDHHGTPNFASCMNYTKR